MGGTLLGAKDSQLESWRLLEGFRGLLEGVDGPRICDVGIRGPIRQRERCCASHGELTGGAVGCAGQLELLREPVVVCGASVGLCGALEPPQPRIEVRRHFIGVRTKPGAPVPLVRLGGLSVAVSRSAQPLGHLCESSGGDCVVLCGLPVVRCGRAGGRLIAPGEAGQTQAVASGEVVAEHIVTSVAVKGSLQRGAPGVGDTLGQQLHGLFAFSLAWNRASRLMLSLQALAQAQGGDGFPHLLRIHAVTGLVAKAGELLRAKEGQLGFSGGVRVREIHRGREIQRGRGGNGDGERGLYGLGAAGEELYQSAP